MTVTEVDDPVQRSRICEAVLRELPGWFGLDDANARYVREVSDLPTFAVGSDAFLALKRQTRRFYEARGFVPLEVLSGVWDAENPCLILVKRL